VSSRPGYWRRAYFVALLDVFELVFAWTWDPLLPVGCQLSLSLWLVLREEEPHSVLLSLPEGVKGVVASWRDLLRGALLA